MTQTLDTPQIYIPPGCLNLAQSQQVVPQIRLGLQGYPKTGKTWGALTFPQPIVLNLDRGLGAHSGREEIIDVPFYNPSYVDTIVMRGAAILPPNRKDALVKWLSTEGQKLTTSQTLVLDGGTGLQNAYHAWYACNKVIGKGGRENEFAEWGLKMDFFTEIVDLLKQLKCDCIYICHEVPNRNSYGELNGMVRPLLTGQFGDELASHFTDWFRGHVVGKPKTDDEIKRFTDKIAGGKPELVKDMMASTDKDCESIYLWQTSGDDIAKCGSSTLVKSPKFIVANFESFNKYRRKITIV